MSGGSKKQTIGYWYKMGLHMGICHGPVDSVMEIRVGDRAAWTGDVTASGQISINAENLFGGKEKEGGIVGACDVMMGEPTQAANSYLASKQAGPQPGYRGFLSLVFRGGKIAANNPYIKPWAVRIKRILAGWDGGSAWYPEKAAVLISGGGGGGAGGSGGPAWLATDSETGSSYVGQFDGSGWALQTNDFSGGIQGPSHRVGDNLYIGSIIHYCNVSDLSAWTPLAGANNNNILKIIDDGTYGYACRTSTEIQRWTLPFGALSAPFAGSTANCVTATIWHGNLYIFRTLDAWCKVSTDAGASYADKTDYRPLGVPVSSPKAASNSDIIVVAFSDNSGAGPIKVSWSEDGADTWTTVTPPIAADSYPVVADCVWDGTRFILTTQTGTNVGRTAYSPDGKVWYAGTTIKDALNIAHGAGKAVIGTSEVNLYESTIAGTFTEMPEIVASTSSAHSAWVYFIGEESAAPTEPDIYAMNPAHIIYQCLTDRQWGLGYPSSKLDLASFTAAANTFHAEGMGLCLEWNQQDAIINFVQMVVDHAGAAIGEDPRTGQFRLKAIRADYSLGSLPEFSAAAGNIISLDGFDRASLTETVNEISVSYTDATTGKEGSVTVQQLANIQAQGAVVAQGRSYPGLPTLDLAVRVALRDLKAAASGLARVRLTVTRAGWTLAPGDVIRFVWPEFGITAMALRIARIDYGSLTAGAISLECIEDVFGLPANTYVKPPSIGWEAPDSTPVAPTIYEAFEVPFRDLVQTMGQDDAASLPVDAGYLCAVALRPAGVPLNYDLRTKVGASAYVSADSGDWCPSATLSVAVAPLDTTLTLADVSDLDEIDVGSAVLLGTEICRVDAVDTTLNTLTVGRGCLDTVPAGWPIGTRVWAYDAFAAADDTQYSDGETVNAKFVTRTSSGVLSEGGSPADSVVMASRAIRPYPPGLLRFLDDLNTVTGLAYPVELAGALTASWAHRDRLLQQDQLIDENDASIGPEASTTYTVTYYQPPGTLVNTESALSGTSATPYTFPADGQAEIRVEASRSGYASWQSAKHIFDYYRYPRITTVAGEPRITDDGSARKVI